MTHLCGLIYSGQFVHQQNLLSYVSKEVIYKKLILSSLKILWHSGREHVRQFNKAVIFHGQHNVHVRLIMPEYWHCLILISKHSRAFLKQKHVYVVTFTTFKKILGLFLIKKLTGTQQLFLHDFGCPVQPEPPVYSTNIAHFYRVTVEPSVHKQVAIITAMYGNHCFHGTRLWELGNIAKNMNI